MLSSRFNKVVAAAFVAGVLSFLAIPEARADRIVYIHTDHLGSPIAETDEQGRLIKRFIYEPYGANYGLQVPTGPGYAGHVSDSETELIYMQQRYYDPYSGRFLSIDPVNSHDGKIEHFNRYWYGAGNPYRYIDPDGQAIQALWGAPIGAVVDIVAQKAVARDAPIDWKSVAISAGVGALSGGVASVARAAAVRGSVTVGQSVVITASGNAGLGAAGSAASSLANGEAPSVGKMAIAAGANGGLSLGAGLASARGVMLEKMSVAAPGSPQGIGNHVVEATAKAARAGRDTSIQSGVSISGRANEAIQAAGVSSAQKGIESRID